MWCYQNSSTALLPSPEDEIQQKQNAWKIRNFKTSTSLGAETRHQVSLTALPWRGFCSTWEWDWGAWQEPRPWSEREAQHPSGDMEGYAPLLGTPCLFLGKPAHPSKRPALPSVMAVLQIRLSDLLISITTLSNTRYEHELEVNMVNKHSCIKTPVVMGKAALKNRCNAFTGTSD